MAEVTASELLTYVVSSLERRMPLSVHRSFLAFSWTPGWTDQDAELLHEWISEDSEKRSAGLQIASHAAQLFGPSQAAIIAEALLRVLEESNEHHGESALCCMAPLLDAPRRARASAIVTRRIIERSRGVTSRELYCVFLGETASPLIVDTFLWHCQYVLDVCRRYLPSIREEYPTELYWIVSGLRALRPQLHAGHRGVRAVNHTMSEFFAALLGMVIAGGDAEEREIPETVAALAMLGGATLPAESGRMMDLIGRVIATGTPYLHRAACRALNISTGREGIPFPHLNSSIAEKLDRLGGMFSEWGLLTLIPGHRGEVVNTLLSAAFAADKTNDEALRERLRFFVPGCDLIEVRHHLISPASK